MWNPVIEMYIPAVFIIVLLSINTLTSMSAPVDPVEGEEDESNKEEANQQETDSEDQESRDTSSTTPCWQTENFLPIGPCAPCHPFASKVLTDSCHETGFNQLVHCAESNQKVYKSCPRSRKSVEKSFWIFEGVTLIIGFFACTVVFFRRRKLNREAAERVRKQISNSV
ncbi:protein JTB-like [Diadema antillarum]|uniref:protein JTB-like n=2 Tax=Diadema antillarum TaxID=105358 RepID=UPI003A8669B9